MRFTFILNIEEVEEDRIPGFIVEMLEDTAKDISKLSYKTLLNTKYLLAGDKSYAKLTGKPPKIKP